MRGLKRKVFGLFKRGKNEENMDYWLLSVILILLAIGVIMVYSASSYIALVNYKNSMYFFIRQLIFAVGGCCAMLFVAQIDYKKLKKIAFPLVFIAMGLLFIILLVKWGILPDTLAPDIKGARRWIHIGPISVQPSEIAKYAAVLFLSIGLAGKGEKVKKFWTGSFPVLIVPMALAGMVFLGKSMSITMVIAVTSFVLVVIAGMPWKQIGICVLSGLTMIGLGIASAGFRVQRFLNFTDPWQDPQGVGYQLIQSFYSLGAGGITGLGLGKSRQKTMYMPEPHNDFIFAIIGEELGLIGCIVIIALFIFFIYRGVVIAFGARDTYGMLLAMGITTIIAIQALINIAVVTGSMPVTGVPLPFISYGGTSLVINLTAMGVLLNISKSSKKSLNNI